MLDLFSGTGGASRAFRAAGYEVHSVDEDPQHGATEVADIRAWSWPGRRPTMVWASPPCDEFTRERLPWTRSGKKPSLELVLAAKRIIQETQPLWWVVENTRGAVPYLDRIFGRFRARAGPFFLWGNIPPFRIAVEPFKERLSGRRKVQRAEVPSIVSSYLLMVIEGSVFHYDSSAS